MTTAAKRIGLLFIHGIAGNNSIFEMLHPLVQQTVETEYIVLEGHGGNALDFSRASMKRWKAQVHDAVAAFSDRCDRIVIIGHSMGCLFALEQAAKGRVAALFLMNPPLRIRPTLGALRNAFDVAMGLSHSRPVASAARKAYGISLDFNPFHYYGWPGRYIELWREARRIREEVVSEVKCPVKVILSGLDEVVSLSSADAFINLPNSAVKVLEESSHYYYPDCDRERIITQFADLLKEL
ncbi:MAG: alpha/beta fold hydrolase [Muribaculaceae bacterium]|nr:alpha/beta fold hydrolase [Muribaculaceae bacterium]